MSKNTRPLLISGLNPFGTVQRNIALMYAEVACAELLFFPSKITHFHLEIPTTKTKLLSSHIIMVIQSVCVFNLVLKVSLVGACITEVI